MKLSDDELSEIATCEYRPTIQVTAQMARELLIFRQAEPAVEAALEELLELRTKSTTQGTDIQLLKQRCNFQRACLAAAEKVVEDHRILLNGLDLMDGLGYIVVTTDTIPAQQALEAYDKVVKND